MTAPAVKLSKTNPVTGKRNPYRTRWAEVDGVVFKAESDSLNGLWTVGVDTDTLDWELEQASYRMREPERREVFDAIMAISMGDRTALVPGFTAPETVYGMSCRLAYRLYGREHYAGRDSVPTVIAEVVDSEQWPTIRAAYVGIRERIAAAVEADRQSVAAWAGIADDINRGRAAGR